MNKPDYISRAYVNSEDGFILYLEDRDLGNMSLTNGMELVLKDLQENFFKTWPPALIFYRDSDGEFAKVNIRQHGIEFNFMEKKHAYLLLASMED